MLSFIIFKRKMKHIIIRNLGPIKNIEVDLKRINLVIGPQSSGKSTFLKVVCYCTWVERQVMRTQDPDLFCNGDIFITNLVEFHKLEGYLKADTYISYVTDYTSITYDAKLNTCEFRWQDERWNYRGTKISYIPAERNIVSVIPNWYQIKMEPNNLFSFMSDWEDTRKNFDNKERILSLPFNYIYDKKTGTDKIILNNGEEISLINASSGIQSLVPLVMTINFLTGDFFNKENSTVEISKLYFDLLDKLIKSNDSFPETSEDVLQKFIIARKLFFPEFASFFIEEPEAHIFPSTQKDFVYNLVEKLNNERQHTCFIATHSPYIMTAINNLILANERFAESEEIKNKILTRFSEQHLLPFNDVAAFAMESGNVKDILDYDFKMILSDALDSASESIANDYDYLLGL